MAEQSDSLMWATKNGDLDAVKNIVEAGKNDPNSVLTGGRTPLHFAADYGHKEVIDYLLSKGAKVNMPDKYGITPLLAAIYEGHEEAVKVLILKGADKSGKAPDGRSYLEVAESDEMRALLK